MADHSASLKLEICEEAEVVVRGNAEPIVEVSLAHLRDLNFILCVWGKMLKDFHQMIEIIGNGF